MSLRRVFSDIFEGNLWKSQESASGVGSEIVNTKSIINYLPELFRKYNISSVVDLGCGDMNWMKEVLKKTGVKYIGTDIVSKIIEKNKISFPEYTFYEMDISSDGLEKYDLAIARDILVHLPFLDIFRAIKNIKSSGTRYLLVTTFMDTSTNTNIPAGDWRPINFQKIPFLFTPKEVFLERSDAPDKTMFLIDMESVTDQQLELCLHYEYEILIRSNT